MKQFPWTRAVRWARNWPAWHLAYSVERVIHGRAIRIPLVFGLGLRNLQTHEPEVSALLSALLQTYPGTFLDIGVNIGQTLLKVVTLDPKREYIGFEPSITCCSYVERLIAKNALANCSLLPVAFAEQAKAINLHFNRDADGAATIVEDFWCGGNAKRFRKTIWAERGDTVLDSLALPTIGIIKIDVEGGEVEVISGLRETLRRHKPPLLLEVLPYSSDIATAGENSTAIENRKQRMERLVALLGEIAYRAFRYQPDGEIVETTEFDAPRYDAAMCNYLLLRPEHAAQLTQIRALYQKALAPRTSAGEAPSRDR